MVTRSSSAEPKPRAPGFGNGAATRGVRTTVVALNASSRLAGDTHHLPLAIAQGAEFGGHCRRAAAASQPTADLLS
jgi:hypothetical protein